MTRPVSPAYSIGSELEDQRIRRFLASVSDDGDDEPANQRVLVDGLSDAEPAIRSLSALALAGTRPTEESNRRLLEVLDDPDAAVRGNAAYAIGHRGVRLPDGAAVLERRIPSETGVTRLFMVYALTTQADGVSAERRRREALRGPRALRDAFDTKTGLATVRVTEALMAVDRRVMLDRLGKVAKDPSYNARYALEEVGRRWPAAVDEPLRRMSDAKPTTRLSAVIVLTSLDVPDPRVAAALGDCAKRTSETPENRRACIHNLGVLGPSAKGETRTLRRLIRGDDPALGEVAATALFLVNPEASTHEDEYLRRRYPEVAREVEVLRRLKALSGYCIH